MQRLSKNLQTIVDELNKLKSTQEISFQSLEVLCSEKLQEIRDLRRKLNADLDALENTTLKELDDIRNKLQTSLKKDVDNCSRLKDDLQTLSEAVYGLCNKNKKEIEFIANRKSLDKIQEFESYLKESPVNVQRKIKIFQANTDIEQYLSKQSSLGSVDSMPSLTMVMNPDQILTVKRKCQYNVKISKDTSQNYFISGMCSLPSGYVIVADFHNNKVKLLDVHYNVSSQCDVSGSPRNIFFIASSEVAVTFNNDVQFISVCNGQLVNGKKFSLQHAAIGIAHHQGALYVTTGTALYHYTLTGSLVKKLHQEAGASNTAYKCAVSPAGDRIYVTNYSQHKLLTLATDGALLSTFDHPELQHPRGIHVTPAGQVLVCGGTSKTVIQVDLEGRKKLATLASTKDGLSYPVSVCCNTNTHQIIVGQDNNSKIIVMDLQ